MVDWDSVGASMPMIGVFLFMPLMIATSVFLAPFGIWATLAGMVLGEAGLFATIRLSRWLAKVLAGLIHHVKCRPTSRKEPYGWKWPGMFVYRWKRHPETIGYLPNYVFQNGRRGGYVTKLKVGLLNRISHPFYNRGGGLKNMLWIHEFPFDEQFAEDEDTVSYRGYNVKGISTVSWANLHEIMPGVEYFRDPKAWNKMVGKHNHVPFVEPDDLSHTPYFEVTDSSGVRAARENRKARAVQTQKIRMAMMAGPRGAVSNVLLCPDTTDGKECALPMTVENGLAVCPKGHKWNDL